MDFSLTPEQEAFRERVRAWLNDEHPARLGTAAMASSEVPRPEAYELLREWQRTLYDAGFIGLTWPKEYGGQGLTFVEEMILHQEMALAKAPPILNILGVGMAGPTIIAYGTEEQKTALPAEDPLLRGDLVPGLLGAERRAPTWPRCRRAPSRTATTG